MSSTKAPTKPAKKPTICASFHDTFPWSRVEVAMRTPTEAEKMNATSDFPLRRRACGNMDWNKVPVKVAIGSRVAKQRMATPAAAGG